jgi:competence protein ComEA
MDLIGEERGRIERLTAWLDATNTELVGLAVLLCGAVVATGALLWAATGPSAPAAEVAGIGAVVDPTSGEDPTAGGHDHDHDRPAASAPPDGEPASLTVHVTGAVAVPGLVVLDDGARVADAIELAGGASDDAELHRLNLARPLHDGEQVHVPVDGEDPPPEASQAADGGDAGGPIDINRADAAALETLPGIGPARAQAIVEHRETHGPFAEPGDLRDVPGIGEATFQRIADDVTTS